MIAGSITGESASGQEAIICRLNSTLFDEVVTVLRARPRARIGFAGVESKKVHDHYLLIVLIILFSFRI